MSMIPTLLFVDPEPTVYQALKRRLGDDETDLFHATSVEAAFKILNDEAVDLLVCVHRANSLEPAIFLDQVQYQSPNTVRLLLSGMSSKEEVADLLGSGAVQHVLLTPWDQEELLAIVQKSLKQSRAQRQKNADLQALINNIPNLPALPDTYQKLQACLSDRGNYSIAKVADIVGKDMTSSAALLRWANSAMFGQMGQVDNIRRAIVLLGVDVVEGVVLANGMKEVLFVPHIDGFNIGAFQQHSMATAVLARILIERCPDRGPHVADQAFIVGLMHDMGKLVWARYFPDLFAEAIRVARETERPLYQVETEILGATHQEIGAYLAAWWSLPQFIVQGLRWHHQPKQSAGDRLISHAVHLADALVQQFSIGHSGNTTLPEIERDSRVRFQLMTPAMLDSLEQPLREKLPTL